VNLGVGNLRAFALILAVLVARRYYDASGLISSLSIFPSNALLTICVAFAKSPALYDFMFGRIDFAKYFAQLTIPTDIPDTVGKPYNFSGFGISMSFTEVAS